MSPTMSLELLVPIWLVVVGCVFAAAYQEFSSLWSWARTHRELEELWAEGPFVEPAEERDASCA